MSLTIESSVQIVNQLSVSMEVGLAGIAKPVPVEQLTVTPSTATVEHYPSSGYYFDKVTANAVTNEIDSNIQPLNIREGVTILGVEGNLEPDKPDQSKTVSATYEEQIITADTGYELASVTVDALPLTVVDTAVGTITPSVVANGYIGYSQGNEIVGTASVPVEQITVTPSTATVEHYPSSGYYFDKVTANAVTNEIDSNIASENIRSGISILGVEGSPTVVNTANATATANDILFGKNAYANGEEIVGEIESYSVSAPIMPTTADQTLPTANKYVETEIVVKGDSKLLPDNIKENTTIFGVEGTVKPQNNGYQRVEGVPNGNEIIANAPDIVQGGVTYKPIYYICARDLVPVLPFTKTGTGRATGADAYVFSDEPDTLYVGTSVPHTFDMSKSFHTVDGWHCVWVIMYATAANKALASGITTNMYAYVASFEWIAAQDTIFSNSTAIGSTSNVSFQYINLEAASFFNNTISRPYFLCYHYGLVEVILPPSLLTVSEVYFCSSNYTLKRITANGITSVDNTSNFRRNYNLTEFNLPLLSSINRGSTWNDCYALRYISLPSWTTAPDVASVQFLPYTVFIELPTNFNITGVDFTGSVTKSYEWLNSELPTKLNDRSSTTSGSIILGAANIAMISAEAAAIIAAKNWTVT